MPIRPPNLPNVTGVPEVLRHAAAEMGSCIGGAGLKDPYITPAMRRFLERFTDPEACAELMAYAEITEEIRKNIDIDNLLADMRQLADQSGVLFSDEELKGILRRALDIEDIQEGVVVGARNRDLNAVFERATEQLRDVLTTFAPDEAFGTGQSGGFIGATGLVRPVPRRRGGPAARRTTAPSTPRSLAPRPSAPARGGIGVPRRLAPTVPADGALPPISGVFDEEEGARVTAAFDEMSAAASGFDDVLRGLDETTMRVNESLAGEDGGLDAFSEALEDAKAEAGGLGEVLGQIEEVGERVFAGLGDELLDFLRTGKAEWRDFARVAVGAIGEILAEQIKLLAGDENAPGGGVGGFLSGLVSGVLGGLFAHGGRPPVGKASLVGERGPELFVPDMSGTIIPSGALAAFAGAGGETVVNTTFNIDARGAAPGVETRIRTALAESERRIAETVMARIIHSARRGGVFARLPRR